MNKRVNNVDSSSEPIVEQVSWNGSIQLVPANNVGLCEFIKFCRDNGSSRDNLLLNDSDSALNFFNKLLKQSVQITKTLLSILTLEFVFSVLAANLGKRYLDIPLIGSIVIKKLKGEVDVLVNQITVRIDRDRLTGTILFQVITRRI